MAGAASLAELGSLASVIKRTPMLSAEEERSLAERVREGDAKAADRLVQSHMRLVLSIASRFSKTGLSLGDLVSEGGVGLVEAVRRFDPSRGFRLSTYASWWIRAYVQNFVLANWSLVKIGTSADQKKLFFSLRKLRSKLQSQGVPEAEHDAIIAAQMGIPLKEVVSVGARLGGDSSLNARMGGEEDGSEFQDLLVDPSESQEATLAESDEGGKRRALLRESLTVLNDRERAIVEARHMVDEPKTLEELAQVYGITRERIRQIEVIALKKVTRGVRRMARERGMPAPEIASAA